MGKGERLLLSLSLAAFMASWDLFLFGSLRSKCESGKYPGGKGEPRGKCEIMFDPPSPEENRVGRERAEVRATK